MKPSKDLFTQRCGKTNHATQVKAERHAFRVLVANGVKLRAYKCNDCAFWHVTSQTVEHHERVTAILAARAIK